MGWFQFKKKAPPPEHEAPAAPCMSYRGANLQGIGSRSEQQDAFAFVNLLDVRRIREQGLLAVAADGMGGMQGGAFASETAVSCIRSGFQNMDLTGSIPEQLMQSFHEADSAIFRKLHGTGGSTAVACLFYQEKLWFASVGDSCLFLKRGIHLYRLNREQNILHDSYREALQNSQLYTDTDPEDREAQAVSQFLGMGELEEIDGFLRPLPLQNGDILMLCSDGVEGVLSEEDILFALARSTPQEMCGDLEKMILQKNKTYQDNYTALIVQCTY